MLVVDDKNFEAEVLKSEVPVVVDFFAEWCGPCKMMAPAFEKVGAEYDGKVKFVKLNVDEARESAMKYGVMSIPTVISYKDGNVVETLVGLQEEAVLTAKAEALIK